MTVKTLTFNPLAEHCYLLIDEESLKTFVIDPGCSNSKEFAELQQIVNNDHLCPQSIIFTHTHFDHAMGAGMVEETYNIPSYAHKEDESLLAKMPHYLSFFGFNNDMQPVKLAGYLHDGDILSLGHSEIHVLHVPGHTRGGVSFYLPQEKILFSGDTLFQGSVGRTDFAEGSAVQLSESLKNKLMTLPDDIKVYPGHGDTTTIGWERKNNPYL